jgi:hypothetical protein
MAFLSSLFIYGTEFFRGYLYFMGEKSKHFYTTVKPFLSKKSTGSQQKIVLVENDKIVNNTKDICDTFICFVFLKFRS